MHMYYNVFHSVNVALNTVTSIHSIQKSIMKKPGRSTQNESCQIN